MHIYIWASRTDFVFIVVYVDDLNIIETPEEINKIAVVLTSEFEMKYLDKPNFVYVYKWNTYHMVC